MLYFDYAANTPACAEALETFCQVTKDFIANPNSAHPLGEAARRRLAEATEQTASLLGVKPEEIIFTSGASEANNLAIKGAAGQYGARGKHIVTTWLEHSSVNGAVAALQERGYEADYAELDENGLVDPESLGELLRDDTVLVSVCMVDSEVGIRQNIPELAKIVHSRPNRLFHVDATQAAGKLPLSFDGVDLLTLGAHKFYGLNGCGALVRRESVLLEPQIQGGGSATEFRSGTPPLGLIASTAAALDAAYRTMDERYAYVSGLNRRLREVLSHYDRVRINSTKESVPFILNLSVAGVRGEQLQAAMAEKGVCLSTKSACCAPNTPSRPVYALTKDRRAALSTLRISLSHLTAPEEVEALLGAFDECYANLVK
jgi:cysteine desulfurase